MPRRDPGSAERRHRLHRVPGASAADAPAAPGRGSPRTISDTPPAGTPPIELDDPERRPPAGDVRAPAGGQPAGRRLRWALGLVVLLSCSSSSALWAFSRTQWYVAESDGRVALFQGVKSRPLGIPLSSVEKTYFPLGCLQPVDESRIRSGYIADSRSDAERYISTLRTLPSTSAAPRVPPDARTKADRAGAGAAEPAGERRDRQHRRRRPVSGAGGP